MKLLFLKLSQGASRGHRERARGKEGGTSSTSPLPDHGPVSLLADFQPLRLPDRHFRNPNKFESKLSFVSFVLIVIPWTRRTAPMNSTRASLLPLLLFGSSTLTTPSLPLLRNLPLEYHQPPLSPRMKYLDAPELAHLADILEYSSAECKVHTRFGQSHFVLLSSLPFQLLERVWVCPLRHWVMCCHRDHPCW